MEAHRQLGRERSVAQPWRDRLGAIMAMAFPARVCMLRRAMLIVMAVSVAAMPLSAPPAGALEDPDACGSQSAERVREFVDRWETRLADRAFMDAWVAATETPPDVAAEGFHELPAAEQGCLAAALVRRLNARHGDSGLDVGPEALQALLHAVVFPDRVDAAQKPAPLEAQEAPVSTALDEALEQLSEQPLREPVQHRQTSDVQLRAPDEMPPHTSSPITVADEATWPVVRDVLRPLPRIPGVGKPIGLYRGLFDASTYQLCAEWGSGMVSCSGALVYGQPASLNAEDVDATPDVVGSLTLLPGASTTGVSATLQLKVDVLPTEVTSPPAHVYAVFERPEANKRLLIGFDGRSDRLARSSQATFTVDLTAAANRVIAAQLDVAHSGASSTSAVVFGASTPGKKGAETDPIRAVVELSDAVPSLFSARVNLDLPNAVYDLGVTAAGSPLVRAAAAIDDTAAHSRKQFGAVINRIPATVDVRVAQEVDRLTARYTASGPIGEVGFADVTVPDLASPQVYDSLSVNATHIPALMEVSYAEPFSLAYSSSGAVTNLGFEQQHVADDTVVSALTGEAAGLPTWLTVDGAVPGSESDALSLRYGADRSIQSLDASFFGPAPGAGDNATAALSAEIDDLPKDIVLVVDPAEHTVTWNADGPVGRLAAQVSAPLDGRDYELAAEVLSIPADWKLTTREDEYSFIAGTRSAPQEIGSVAVTATNHGAVDARADDPGNKALFRLDETTGDLDAALRVSNIELFEYLPTSEADPDDPTQMRSGLLARVHAGGGLPFLVDVDLRRLGPDAPNDPVTQLAVVASLDPLPTQITIEQAPSGKLHYGGANTDLDVEAAIGRVDAIDEALAELAGGTLPMLSGVVLRDGAVCDPGLSDPCGQALLAGLHLDGAPASLTYQPESSATPMTINVNGYAPPPGATLGADITLDDDLDEVSAPKPVLRLGATLRGFAAGGQDFQVGPIKAHEAPNGDLDIAVHVSSTAPIDPGQSANAVVAQVQKGDVLVHAEVSNVPQTIDIVAQLGSNALRFYAPLSHPIRSARVTYNAANPHEIVVPPAPGAWQLDAKVTDLSKTTDLFIYPDARPDIDPCDPDPPPQFPQVLLTAAAAGTDVVASVDASLIDPALTGRLEARLDDLGSIVTTTFNTGSKQVNIASSPPTKLLDVRIPEMRIEATKAFGPGAPCYVAPGDGVDAELTGAINVIIDLLGAQVTVEDLSALELRPGFATGVKGTFSQFLLGWQGLTVGLQPDELTGQLVIHAWKLSLPLTPEASVTLEQPANIPVGVDFHLYEHINKPIFFQRNYAALESCDPTEETNDFDRHFLEMTENPTALQAYANGFVVTPANSDARYTVIANPYGVIPGGLLDLITVLFLGAYDHGYGVRGGCTDEYDPWGGPPNSIVIF